VDEKPELELPAWAARSHAFIHGVREITEDIFDLLRPFGDAFFESRFELDAALEVKLAGCLNRLDLAAFNGARLKFQIGDRLAAHFEPKTLIDFTNALRDREFNELRSTFDRLELELKAFEMEVSATLVRRLGPEHAANDQEVLSNALVSPRLDPQIMHNLYASALKKLEAWASKKQQFDPGYTLCQSFFDHVNPSIEAIAMRLRVARGAEPLELSQLEQCKGAVLDDLLQFDEHAVSPKLILAPIQYDYDWRDPDLGPVAIPMLMEVIRAGIDGWGSIDATRETSIAVSELDGDNDSLAQIAGLGDMEADTAQTDRQVLEDASKVGVQKEYASGTKKENSKKNNRVWDANAKRMARRYISACKKAGRKLSRIKFIEEELINCSPSFPDALAASTIDHAFKQHQEKWKPRLEKALEKTPPDAD
jgi:hypothetical protein